MQDLGRFLLLFGAIMVMVGGFLYFFDRVPFLGKLPGDILIKRGNFTFYAPIVTSIIISIILTIVLNLIFRIKN